MKKDSKKTPDATLRLWVNPYSLEHETGLMSVGNISYREYWVGHKNKLPNNIYPWHEEEEYLSLSQAWHEAKEVPLNLHTWILVVNKHFLSPVVINLEQDCLHGILDDASDSTKWNKVIRRHYRFAFWAYWKDLIPSKEEGGKK